METLKHIKKMKKNIKYKKENRNKNENEQTTEPM